ncbi:MAG: serine/threonine protein kinase [Victivallales bacterium]|nr:serine/threonine protein kinase [Victivallales bacterium]
MPSQPLQFTDSGELAAGGVARLRKITLSDGHTAVLRELQTGKLLNLTLRGRFRRGAEIRRMLSPHTAIANSLETGSRFFRPYEIIEFVNGVSLRTLLTRNDARLKQDAMDMLIQMARGLAWVHQHKIMHLDVKPENFLVEYGENGVKVKLTDFDLSREADDHGPRRQMGTPAFMAPEQFTERLSYMASDVFAFGLIAYQLFSGRRPFSGKTVKETWRNQANPAVHPQPLRELAPELPVRVEAAIMKCLAKPLNERFRTMEQVLQALIR